MTRALICHHASPGVTVQDAGRPGYLAQGVSRGGAADRLALAEGAALLRQGPELAALELAGLGGAFEATEDMRIALTGAPMRANIDGKSLAWNASHLLRAGERLVIGAARQGSYGYLHLGGGVATPLVLGARGVHLAASVGRAVQAGERLPVGEDAALNGVGLTLDPAPRYEGGNVRVVTGPQTAFFDPQDQERFAATTFTRDMRGNRMGVRWVPDGEGFHSQTGLSVLSEVIVPGDIQITGDGTPFVLLSECQTTGGYPRIGSVIPSDLPIVAQAVPGTRLRFEFIALKEAADIERREAARRAALGSTVRPLLRDPHDMADLLAYQLISGVSAGDELERRP